MKMMQKKIQAYYFFSNTAKYLPTLLYTEYTRSMKSIQTDDVWQFSRKSFKHFNFHPFVLPYHDALTSLIVLVHNKYIHTLCISEVATLHTLILVSHPFALVEWEFHANCQFSPYNNDFPFREKKIKCSTHIY